MTKKYPRKKRGGQAAAVVVIFSNIVPLNIQTSIYHRTAIAETQFLEHAGGSGLDHENNGLPCGVPRQCDVSFYPSALSHSEKIALRTNSARLPCFCFFFRALLGLNLLFFDEKAKVCFVHLRVFLIRIGPKNTRQQHASRETSFRLIDIEVYSRFHREKSYLVQSTDTIPFAVGWQPRKLQHQHHQQQQINRYRQKYLVKGRACARQPAYFFPCCPHDHPPVAVLVIIKSHTACTDYSSSVSGVLIIDPNRPSLSPPPLTVVRLTFVLTPRSTPTPKLSYTTVGLSLVSLSDFPPPPSHKPIYATVGRFTAPEASRPERPVTTAGNFGVR